MHIRRLLALVLLGLSVSAAADFRTIIEVNEVSVGDMRLPRSAVGTLTFKQCAECQLQTVRVNSKTRYVLNDRDVELADFRDEFKRVKHENTGAATMMHHLESNTIITIKVNL